MDAKTDEKLDQNGIVTKESNAMDCIGFVSYMYGLNCQYDAANFQNYTEFTKLSINNLDELLPGDVIQWVGNDNKGKPNNHVSIYTPDHDVMEASLIGGVRIRKDYCDYYSWYKKNHTDIKVSYYRYSKK